MGTVDKQVPYVTYTTVNVPKTISVPVEVEAARTIMVPKQVLSTKTVEVPKTVYTESTTEEAKTVKVCFPLTYMDICRGGFFNCRDEGAYEVFVCAARARCLGADCSDSSMLYLSEL